MSKTRNRFSSEVRGRAVRDGFGSRGRTRLGLGGCFLDSWEDRLHGADGSMSG